MQDIILFGVQGSGKGTQSRLLAEKLSASVFETGGALRAIVAGGSELGTKIKGIMDSGNLVPTEVVMEAVGDFLAEHEGENIIFDGIPRSPEQYELFEEEMVKAGRKPTALHIKLSEETALARLLSRKTCTKCGTIYGPEVEASAPCPKCGGVLKVRSDDTEEAIRQRFAVFARETFPLLENYAAAGRLMEVEGDQEVVVVTEEILEKLA